MCDWCSLSTVLCSGGYFFSVLLRCDFRPGNQNSAQSSVTQMCMRNVWNSEKLNPEASEGLGFQRGQTTNFINTIKPDIWGWSWNIEEEKKKKVDSAPHLNQQQQKNTTKLPTYGMCGNGTLAPESAVENHRCRNLAALCRESRAIRGKFFKPEVVQNFLGLMIACIALSPLSWADSLRSHVVLHEWLTSFIARFFFISTEVVYLQRWHGWFHMKLQPSRRKSCVHHTTMLHVTSCKATYVRCMRV